MNINDHVELTLDWSDMKMFRPWPTLSTIRGVIVESNIWDEENTLKIILDIDMLVPRQQRSSVINKSRIISHKIL